MLFLSALNNAITKHNVIYTTSKLLKELQVKISISSIRKALEEHPDYPSLLSISDALTSWKIENISIKIE